jgi:predicted Na+-dependent transporter
MAGLRTLARAARGPSLVVTAVLLGLRFPAPERLAAATTPLVAFLVFAAVHDADWAVFRTGTRPRFAAGAVAAVYVLPVAFAPVPAAVLDGPMRVGTLVVLAGPPTAGSAIVWSRLGGGDATATVLATTIALAAAPLATPAVLGVVLDHGVAIDPVPLARTLVLAVGGGILLSWVVPSDAVAASTFDALSLTAVTVLVYVGTATTTLGGVTGASLAAVGLLAVAFLALASVLAAGCAPLVGRERAVSLFFATGLRNLGIAVAVVSALSLERALVAVVAFYVAQQLVAAVAAEGLQAGRVVQETGSKR